MISKIIIFVALLFVSVSFAGAPYGSSSFYIDFVYSNAQYGTGAAFNARAWYNNNGGNFIKMRVDYLCPNFTLLQAQYFDFNTQDRYQVCGSTCARQTYVADAPTFTTSSGYSTLTTGCPTADFAYPKCETNCAGFFSNPNQPQGVNQIGFNTTTGNLCIVRWSINSPDTAANEWHITRYVTSGFTAFQNPTNNQTYQDVIKNINCPQPTCQATADIALVIDESGSISNANAYPAVQSFALAIVNSFNGSYGPNGTRMGLTYFSGIDNCRNCSDPGTWSKCSSSGCNNNNGICTNCGGRWDVAISPPTTDQARLQNTLITHPIQNGYTCLSCGVQQGANILTASPRPGVPKIMFFFTDGQDNRWTSYLHSVSLSARNQGITIYAVGVSNYNYNSLLNITASASRVFSANSFNELVNIVPQLVRSTCSPLPPFTVCPNCQGLCACSATCTCPSSCDDNNVCTTDTCNVVTTQGKCLYTPNALNCNDNNFCTQNLCDARTGCYFPPIVRPSPPTVPADNLCTYYTCQHTTSGANWIANRNSTSCVGSDPCVVTYCDTSTNSCRNINRNTTSGTITYTNNNGQVVSVPGCAPVTPDPCFNYFCSVNGSCVSQKICQCINDADCYDGTGCTNDRCVNNVCVRTNVDCYSQLSNGACAVNTNYTTSNATGYQVYIGNLQAVYTQVDANGLPSPNSLTTRTCDQLACYGGVPSTYYCQSTGVANNAYTCVRSTASACTLSACADNICRSVGQTGSWAGGNLRADCGVTIVPNCNDNNVCTSDACNINWQRTQPVAQRCTYTSNSTNCNKPSVCFTYGCNAMTGCTQTPISITANNTCFQYYCDSVNGTTSIDVSAQNCPQFADKCLVRYCNVSTGCQFVNKSNIFFNTFQTVTNSNGQQIIVAGCRTPSGSPPCLNYYCNSTSGNCVRNDTCQCYVDTDCNDRNGCTVDRCVNNFCVRTNIDCFSQLSNGSCALNSSYTTSNATGYQVYIGNLNSVYTQVDANGNPSPSSGVPRTCDQLACYNGQPSTYSCQSNGDYVYTCARTVSQTCTLSSCRDTICQSMGQTSGSWPTGNLRADCGVTIIPNCNDNNVCTSDSCNTTWSRTDSPSLRCIKTDNSSTCNPNNVCRSWGCNPTTGCFANTLPLPANTTCLAYYCDPVNGNTSYCRNQCNDPNKCRVSYCNVTTDQCLFADKNTFTGTQTFQDCSGLISVTGCAAPPGSPSCLIYSCNATTGNCELNNTCGCLVDGDCNDKNGCTDNKCIANACVFTKRDCYSELSNGTCSLGTAYSTSNATGYSFYIGTNTSLVTTVDGNGLPSPSSGVPRNCDQLACYGGVPSTYSCQSTGDFSSVCVRSTSTACTLSSCRDTICQSVGQAANWTNIQADCGVAIIPSCNDGNLCTSDVCNTTWSHSASPSLRCINADNSSTCNPNNACLNWGCNSATGCTSSPVVPPTNTTCYGYYCDSSLGIQQVCIGTQQCPPNPNKCIINYCNNTNCVTVQTTDFDFGTTQTFVDGCGTFYPVSGCRKRTTDPYCVSYSCDTATGNCIKTDTCQCYVDSDCYDNTGCTLDRCVNYTCVRTNIDCYSQLSNGSCALNTNYPRSNETGYQVYIGNLNPVYTALDLNGNPTPSSGVTRSCDQLACYNGQPSTYSCLSTGNANGAYTCSRTVVQTCSLGSCSDTICQSVEQSSGTWATGNLQADCGVTIIPDCNDNNVCTDDSCNSTWSRPSPVSERCIHADITYTCNPGDVCYAWGCNPTTKCFKTLLPLLGSNNTCFEYSCDPSKGNQTFEVGTAKCPQDTTNYCKIQYCDPNSKSCQTIDLSTTTAGTSVTYTNSLGATYTVVGCAKPSTDNATCRQYSCDPTNGQCIVNTSSCVCLFNSDCNDKNGCTNDFCDVINNKCVYTPIDCFSEVSNQGCTFNSTFTGSTTTGSLVWNGTAQNNLFILDSNGLPVGTNNGFRYNCDQLGCYNNQPSSYFCSSTGDNAHKCFRLATNCTSNGCAAGRCRTYGNWTSGQITADCSNYFYSTCISTDRCKISYCNSSVSDPRDSKACFLQSINVTFFCDDGDFCTEDKCDSKSTSKSPCYHVAYKENTLKKTLCKKFSVCQTVSCKINSCIYTNVNCNYTNLCTYYVCNATTNNKCIAVNSTVYKYDRCGVCLGRGLSCFIRSNVTPKGVSIGVAVGVGVGISGFFACAAAIFAARKGYDKYKELSSELNGQVKVSEAYKGAEGSGENPGLRASAIDTN